MHGPLEHHPCSVACSFFESDRVPFEEAANRSLRSLQLRTCQQPLHDRFQRQVRFAEIKSSSHAACGSNGERLLPPLGRGLTLPV
jgi:hypothetical protein